MVFKCQDAMSTLGFHGLLFRTVFVSNSSYSRFVNNP
uniref:Uncharacterized protein n=1 Tax=Lotus japonicus TaxID=34305 RepID=I3SJW3_LOTJA|nr:unknown [Lotus japonicus]